MSQNDTPGSVRIRTGEGNEWRYDSIQRAADYYECNRSNAVAYACEDVIRIIEAAIDVLEREDLSLEQRREIAETFSTRGIEFDVDLEVNVRRNP